MSCMPFCCFCFFKQKTAYDMRISDWSSDVCSSDLVRLCPVAQYAVCGQRLGPDDVAHFDAREPGLGGAERQAADRPDVIFELRSEERRVGKECVSTCR